MSGILGNGAISIDCPGCGHKTEKTIAWIKANKEFTCVGCGRPVAVHADDLLAKLKEAEDRIAQFRSRLGSFGKRK